MVIFVIRKFLKMPAEFLANKIKKIALLLLLIGVIFLLATGRLNAVFAFIGIFIAFILRMLPGILRYIPQLYSLWAIFRNKHNTQSTRQSNKNTTPMTKDEAYKVLGLKTFSSKQDIILAHKKLIQKLHPDKEGSDYFATKINQAKKILLE